MPIEGVTAGSRPSRQSKWHHHVRKENMLEVAEDKKTIQGKMEVAGLVGPLWCIGWLFTIGFTHLGFGKAVLALALWPYYLGRALG